jgi:hypothetical protein
MSWNVSNAITPSRALEWVLIGFVLTINVYRAATQSITHDEALTYLLFMRGNLFDVFAYTGNQNHVLQALLSKLVISILPTNPFTLRLPVLAAATLYCVAAAKISNRLFDNGWVALASVALLTLNPYVLDFLSAARGYGLMLGFVLLATYLLLPGMHSDRTRAIAGVLLGLAVAATTVSIFPMIGILVACAVYPMLSAKSMTGVKDATILGIVAALVALPTLANQMYHARRGDYYIGAESIPVWFASLVYASARHLEPSIRMLSELTTGELIGVAGLAAVLALVVGIAISRTKQWSARPREDALIWLVLVMVGMTAVALAVHFVFRLRYPQGRTALYWIPFITLAAMVAFDSTPKNLVLRLTGWMVITFVLATYVVGIQVRSYADWDFDASDDAIMTRIVADHAARSESVTVGGSWQLEPSVNFYRITRKLDWMFPMERRVPSPGYDYYVLLSRDRIFVDRLGLRVLFADPRTGTTLAAAQVNSSRQSSLGLR